MLAGLSGQVNSLTDKETGSGAETEDRKLTTESSNYNMPKINYRTKAPGSQIYV